MNELVAMSEVIFPGTAETDPSLKYPTNSLQESQPYNLLSISQSQLLLDKQLANRREDNANIITVWEYHPSPVNVVVLPDEEALTIPIGSTSGHTHKARPHEMPAPNPANQAPPIEIYTAYALTDKSYSSKIKEQLDILRRQGWPISCHESEIIHSTEWRDNDHLATANLILLLVSTSFLNSDFCYCERMYEAVERHRVDKLCYVIPIILHPLHLLLLERTPFGKLDFLPKGGKPISKWKDPREAYADIIGYLIEKMESMAYYR